LLAFYLLSVESIRVKLAGELKNTTDNGNCICYFETTGELFTWNHKELRAIVGPSSEEGIKNPALAGPDCGRGGYKAAFPGDNLNIATCHRCSQATVKIPDYAVCL
jgi:hypothetical protein